MTQEVVYFAKSGNRVKIGYTSDLARRLKALRTANGSEVTLLGTIPGGKEVEAAAHKYLHDHRARGEWFEYTEELRAFIFETKKRGAFVPPTDYSFAWDRNRTENQESFVIEAAQRIYALADHPSIEVGLNRKKALALACAPLTPTEKEWSDAFTRTLNLILKATDRFGNLIDKVALCWMHGKDDLRLQLTIRNLIEDTERVAFSVLGPFPPLTASSSKGGRGR